MLSKITKIRFALITLMLPVLTNAQFVETRGLLEEILDIVRNVLIPLVFTLALLFFFWGVAKYIWSEGQGKDEGKKIMVWGVIALFVMSSIWGIVYFIGQEIGGGVGDPYNVDIPNINIP